MSLGTLTPDAVGQVSQMHSIGNERWTLFPSAGGDGHDLLGRGPGLRGTAYQQPQEHPQCHWRLSLAAGQN